MAIKTWTLTDKSTMTHESACRISSADMPKTACKWSVTQRTLHGGLSDGVDLIEIDNGRLRIFVLPTRGMGVWKAQLDDSVIGWKSPVRGPVHPGHVPLFEPSGLGWLEGFDEFIVRCGLESNGAPEFDDQGRLRYPLHGRIANRPAYFVDVTVDDVAQTISVRGFVEETRFHFQKLRLEASLTTAFDSTEFKLNDRVENYGGTAAGMQMLYHINIGEPRLAPGDQFVAPVRNRTLREGTRDDRTGDDQASGWDTYGPPVAGQGETCYYMDLAADDSGRSQVLLKHNAGTAGTAVSFDTNTLPCFTLWKNPAASEDGYVTGMEPGTNFPNTRNVEAQSGRVVMLESGASWSTEIGVRCLTSAKEVYAVEGEICQLGVSRGELS
ncbi:aldose 1-epimerase family protein [Adhaeretor mobilis]|uniref:DUF4432 domain-containing protein n=1 Tax=Adhaeretor mobilis TaxID=1930276 RepID=A0A517MTS8_9BACT|nr:aldose 1-epimerase family protein [Adhaeretor mobilis]QDS98295.1 hypothetical protein HG15A2_15680 [Adhaeretor mobilis]